MYNIEDTLFLSLLLIKPFYTSHSFLSQKTWHTTKIIKVGHFQKVLYNFFLNFFCYLEIKTKSVLIFTSNQNMSEGI